MRFWRYYAVVFFAAAVWGFSSASAQEGMRLLEAVRSNQLSQIENLLSSGSCSQPAIDAALIEAVKEGVEEQIVALLLKQGASPGALDTNGRNAISYVFAPAGKVAAVAVVPIPLTPRRRSYAQQLIGAGAEVGGNTPDGETVVGELAYRGETQLLQQVLAQGISPDIRGKAGRTPLMAAVVGKQKLTVPMLLARRAGVDLQDAEGKTALMLAASGGDFQVAKLLLDHGASPHLADAQGNTALHFAAKSGSGVLIALLKRHGANSRQANSLGQAPLGAAQGRALVEAQAALGGLATGLLQEMRAPSGGAAKVQKLLEQGADVSASGSDGNTPLLLAAINDLTDAAVLLLNKGAAPNAANRQGKTPLRYAVEHRNLYLVKALLRKGADPDLADAVGQTPRGAAQRLGFEDVLRLLAVRGADTLGGVRPGETILK